MLYSVNKKMTQFQWNLFLHDIQELSNVNVEPLEDLVLPDALVDYRKFRGLFFTVAHICHLPLDHDLTIVKNHPMGNYRAVDVDLMVYDLSSELNGVNSALLGLGIGAFHTGIRIFDTEISFCVGDGIHQNDPKDSHIGIFREIVPLGKTYMSPARVNEILKELALTWRGDTYNILTHNCNQFCDEFALRIVHRKIPKSITTLAKMTTPIRDFINKPFTPSEEYDNWDFYEVSRTGLKLIDTRAPEETKVEIVPFVPRRILEQQQREEAEREAREEQEREIERERRRKEKEQRREERRQNKALQAAAGGSGGGAGDAPSATGGSSKDKPKKHRTSGKRGDCILCPRDRSGEPSSSSPPSDSDSSAADKKKKQQKRHTSGKGASGTSGGGSSKSKKDRTHVTKPAAATTTSSDSVIVSVNGDRVADETEFGFLSSDAQLTSCLEALEEHPNGAPQSPGRNKQPGEPEIPALNLLNFTQAYNPTTAPNTPKVLSASQPSLPSPRTLSPRPALQNSSPSLPHGRSNYREVNGGQSMATPPTSPRVLTRSSAHNFTMGLRGADRDQLQQQQSEAVNGTPRGFQSGTISPRRHQEQQQQQQQLTHNTTTSPRVLTRLSGANRSATLNQQQHQQNQHVATASSSAGSLNSSAYHTSPVQSPRSPHTSISQQNTFARIGSATSSLQQQQHSDEYPALNNTATPIPIPCANADQPTGSPNGQSPDDDTTSSTSSDDEFEGDGSGAISSPVNYYRNLINRSLSQGKDDSSVVANRPQTGLQRLSNKDRSNQVNNSANVNASANGGGLKNSTNRLTMLLTNRQMSDMFAEMAAAESSDNLSASTTHAGSDSSVTSDDPTVDRLGARLANRRRISSGVHDDTTSPTSAANPQQNTQQQASVNTEPDMNALNAFVLENDTMKRLSMLFTNRRKPETSNATQPTTGFVRGAPTNTFHVPLVDRPLSSGTNGATINNPRSPININNNASNVVKSGSSENVSASIAYSPPKNALQYTAPPMHYPAMLDVSTCPQQRTTQPQSKLLPSTQSQYSHTAQTQHSQQSLYNNNNNARNPSVSLAGSHTPPQQPSPQLVPSSKPLPNPNPNAPPSLARANTIATSVAPSSVYARNATLSANQQQQQQPAQNGGGSSSNQSYNPNPEAPSLSRANSVSGNGMKVVRVVRKGETPVKVMPAPVRSVSVARKAPPLIHGNLANGNGVSSPSYSANGNYGAYNNMACENAGTNQQHSGEFVEYSPNEPNSTNYENYVNNFVNCFYENDNTTNESNLAPEMTLSNEMRNENYGAENGDGGMNNDPAYVNYINSLMFSIDDGVK